MSQYDGCATYVIRNIVNGVYYIGSTVNLRERLYRHRYQLERGIHDNHIFQSSFTSWFDYEISYYKMPDVTAARNREQDLLRFHRGDFYLANIGTGAFGTWDDGMPYELRESIRKAKLGSILSPEHRDRISMAMRGKPKSPEHARRVGEAQRGKVYSGETIDRMRAAARKSAVSIDGIVYESRLDAVRKLNIGRGMLDFRLRSDNYPHWKYHET